MAIVNKRWRQGEFVPKGAEPGLTRRFQWRDADQEKVVRDIASQRFGFPNSSQPHYKTFTNRPARQIGIPLPDGGGDLAFPDVVVVDRDTAVRMIGEVESQRTLRDLDATSLAEKWRTFAGLAELYVFVPMIRLDDARKIIKDKRVPVTGLRTWRYITGQDILDVTDVSI